MPVATFYVFSIDSVTSGADERHGIFTTTNIPEGTSPGQINIYFPTLGGPEISLGHAASKLGNVFHQSELLIDFGERKVRGLDLAPDAPALSATINSVTLKGIASNSVAGDTGVHYSLAAQDGRWNFIPAASGWNPLPSVDVGSFRQRIYVSGNATPVYDVAGANDTSLRPVPPFQKGFAGQCAQVVDMSATPSGVVSGVSFFIRRVGLTSGTMFCKVYRVDGDGAPTGSPIAVSSGFDLAALDTSFGERRFAFSTTVSAIDLSVELEPLAYVVEPVWGPGNGNGYVRIRYGAANVQDSVTKRNWVNGDQDGPSLSTILHTQDVPWSHTGAGRTSLGFEHSPRQAFTVGSQTAAAETSYALPVEPFQEWVNDPSYPFPDQVVLMLFGSEASGSTLTRQLGENLRVEIDYTNPPEPPSEPLPCDWFGSETGPDWQAAQAGPDWQAAQAGPDWQAAQAGPDWASPASGGWFDPKECG